MLIASLFRKLYYSGRSFRELKWQLGVHKSELRSIEDNLDYYREESPETFRRANAKHPFLEMLRNYEYANDNDYRRIRFEIARTRPLLP